MNLKELSNRLNLSQTTVSRALNGYPEVSAKTKQRVVDMARDLGYAPNQQAQRLATGKTMSIGHVLPRSPNEMLNPIFMEFIAGAGLTYAQYGYDMMISVVANDDEEATYREIANRKKVDGIIVHAPRRQETRHKLLKKLNIPFLMHGRITGAEAETSWVDINNRRAFERATQFLLDLGHRRIGFLNGNEEMDFAVRRKEGYINALTKAGCEIDPTLMHSSEMTEPLGTEFALNLLRSSNPPTAFLTSSITLAIGAETAVKSNGLQVGNDVSIITHDDVISFLPNSGESPHFTCIRSSVGEAGQRAAEILITDIIDRESNDRHVTHMMEADLILGQSTGPAPQNRG